MKRRFTIGFFSMLIVSALVIAAKAPPTDYKFHSIYVYNFTKYIEWPQNAGAFRIAILGSDATVLDSFQKMAETKQVSGNKIEVEQARNINNLMDCNILFVPESESYAASKAIEKCKGKNTLVITEKNGLIDNGSCINFVLVDNRLKFEISRSAIESAGLKVSSQLLQMGIEK